METSNQHIDPTGLLVKYITGDAAAAEILQVEQWIAADAENQKYYEHFKQIWDESIALADTNVIDEDKAWERFRERIHNEYVSTTIPVKKYLWLKVAAVVAVISAAVAFLPGLFNHREEARFASSANSVKKQSAIALPEAPASIAVTTDEVRTDTLPDGSTITLNKNSMLSRPANFTAKTRNVALSGEAFFDIKHDPKRPFIINVNNVKIIVLGTSFNVKSTGNTTEVVVETGLVSVQTQQQTVTLHPGEKLTANVMRCKVVPVADESYRQYLDAKPPTFVKDQIKPTKDKVMPPQFDRIKHDSVRMRPDH